MLSAKIPPTSLVNVETNMVWDGLFHALTWGMSAIGIAMLWHAGKQRDVPWSGRTFFGAMVLGWGVFNVVEGTLATTSSTFIMLWSGWASPFTTTRP